MTQVCDVVETLPEVFPVTDLVRRIVVERASENRTPKVGIRRLESGEADSEPLMQSYAKLAYILTTEYGSQIVTKDTELRESSAKSANLVEDNKFLLNAIYKIRNRVRGSIFGKSGAIQKITDMVIEKFPD